MPFNHDALINEDLGESTIEITVVAINPKDAWNFAGFKSCSNVEYGGFLAQGKAKVVTITASGSRSSGGSGSRSSSGRCKIRFAGYDDNNRHFLCFWRGDASAHLQKLKGNTDAEAFN